MSDEHESQATTTSISEPDRVAANKYDRPLVTLDANPLIAYVDGQAGVAQSKKDRDDALEVGKLLRLQRLGVIRIMVGLSTALEKQRKWGIRDMGAEVARLEALGIEREDIYTVARTIAFFKPSTPGIAYFGIDPDTGIPYETMFHWRIHAFLFEGKSEPDAHNVDFHWPDYRDRQSKRLGITSLEQQALVELDAVRWHFWNTPPPPAPTFDALCPRRQGELDKVLSDMYEYWHNKKNDSLGLSNHAAHAAHTSVPQHAVFVTSDHNFTKKTTWKRLQAIGFPGHILEPKEAVAYLRRITGATLADSDQP